MRPGEWEGHGGVGGVPSIGSVVAKLGWAMGWAEAGTRGE